MKVVKGNSEIVTVAKSAAPGRRFPLLLAALMAATALSIDMSLPAMPEIAKSFGAPVGAVQLTLSLFLVGYALGQLVCGPISDRLGRRPVMMVALYAYSLAGFACFLSQSLNILVCARLIQGLAASAVPVVSRAIVRDCYDHRSAARVLTQTTQIKIAVPLLAPVVGDYLMVWFGWPSIFFVLGLAGIVPALICHRLLPETSARTVSEEASQPTVSPWKACTIVLAHRATLRHLLTGWLVYSGMFAYISNLPFVATEVFGVAKQHFAYVFAMTALALLAGASANRKLLSCYAPFTLLRLGAIFILAGGVLMPILAWFHLGGLAGIVGPMMVFIFGMGILLPNATAAAMAPHDLWAGTASSLMGAGQTGGGALAGYVVSRLYCGTSMAMAVTVAVSAVLVFLAVDHRAPALMASDVDVLMETESIAN